jgi:integrase
MSGAIRTKERCPICGKAFGPSFICDPHKTIPTRFYVDLSWKGLRIKIYSDKRGDPLDSYRRAFRIHSDINEEINDHSFDPAKYLRQDVEKFRAKNLLARFRDAKIDSMAPSYKKDFKRMVSRASAFFGNADVRDLRKLDLINYQNSLEASGIRAKYQKNHMGVLKTFLRWCRSDLEVLDIVPPIPIVHAPEKPPRWLAKEDQIKILEHIPEEDQPIIKFLMLSGCRPAEARALRVRDVDLRQETVTITSTFSGHVLREQRKGRGSVPVTLPIHPEVLAYFKKSCALSLPGAFVFINPRGYGGPYTERALQKVWSSMRVRAKISLDLRLYDATRHSVATQLRLAGVPLPDIKDQLGHSDIRTTMKYAHGNLEALRSNLDKLSLRKVEKLQVKSGSGG